MTIKCSKTNKWTGNFNQIDGKSKLGFRSQLNKTFVILFVDLIYRADKYPVIGHLMRIFIPAQDSNKVKMVTFIEAFINSLQNLIL